MKYIKLFESFNDTLNKVDDIAAYISAMTGKPESQWCLPDLDLKSIKSDEQYEKYTGLNKKHYLRYYIFAFYGMNNLFLAESDIRNRAKSYNLKFLVIQSDAINTQNHLRVCKIIFFKKEDWDKLDLDKAVKNLKKGNWDVLFENDIKIEKDEFNILYDDDDIIAVRPKTYRAAIRYSADSPWKASLKKSDDWIKKYMTTGSYYGGTNWYKSKIVTKEVNSWWRKLLKLPPKQSKEELKEFFTDFPRYLFYIVIFKNAPMGDNMKKLYLLYDVSRGENGELPHNFSSDYFFSSSATGGYWGDVLDSAHNNVKIVGSGGNLVTLQDIQNRHGSLFNRAFREIESDYNEEKQRLYDLLGVWANKGGEYRDDAIVFIRSKQEPNRLQIARSNRVEKTKDHISWTRAGYYDDPHFNYWDLDKEKPNEKPAPRGGEGYKDFFSSMQEDYLKLMDSLEKNDGFKL